MEKKIYQGEMRLKENAEQTGEFEAVFATLKVRDHDEDVTLDGAFGAQEAPVAHYGHNHVMLPVGRGRILERDGKAIMEGRFFLDTQGGREHYLTVKNLGGLQQWSYAFDVLDEARGSFEGHDVRFLKALKVHEVSPVLVGAGIGTETTEIKTGDEGDCHGRVRPRNDAGSKAVTRSEADGDHPAGHYLVVEDPEKPSTWHLRVRDVNGEPDHRLMGAAWAALHGGYRGNVYEGPGKREALGKLMRLYEQEAMDVPKADWDGETKAEGEGASGAKPSGEAELVRARIDIELMEA